MDGFVAFVILLIVISLLEKFLKAGRQKGASAPPPPEIGGEAGESDGLPKNLGDLIAEELGFNLERRPTVKQLPDASAERAAARPEAEYRREPARLGEQGAPADRTRVERVRRRRAARSARRRLQPPDERRPPLPPAERRRSERLAQPLPWEGEAFSLEEQALRERGEAISLERERRPEDHDRFHDRYGVPQPVATHQEFHDRYVTRPGRRVARQRRGIPLPDRRSWSDVQRAIIWAEVLGPPKGLE